MNQKEYCLYNKIKFFDNVINPMEVETLRQKITKTPMTWTGKDADVFPTNTLTKDFTLDDPILKRLQSLVYKVEPKLEQHKFIRAGINLIMPQTNPSYFHFDGKNVITCLFYITPKLEQDDGGETQFDLGSILLGIKPVPGRLCIFHGSINHRTSYFRNKDRITVFLKFHENIEHNIFDKNYANLS